MTFREAYERTGRILNVSVIPNDVHSPPMLVNYVTAPDTVIWSALLASAAVPGILQPVPLMQKLSDGRLVPYNFGHKWKDGSLRTDIPISALNTYFNVTYSIVSQANPHVKLWFYNPRGTVGRPVTHREGRGWRGGFLGSALEQFLKHDMFKWLRVLRDLELLPRPAGQDWSSVFLQKFEGNITIWPKTVMSDFRYILSDPTVERLARMMLYGERATYPKILFITNRMRIERLLEQGRALARSSKMPQDLREGGTVLSASEYEAANLNRRRPTTTRVSSKLTMMDNRDIDGSTEDSEVDGNGERVESE